MATCETMSALENDDCISDTIDFSSFLQELEGLDQLVEPIRPDSCHPDSSQDGQNPSYHLEELGIISAADLMADIEKENVTEINNSHSISTKNTSSVQEMSRECNKRKHSEMWFLDELALDEPSPKRSVLKYLEINTAQPQRISKRVRNVQQSMRVKVLKGLTSKKVRESWAKKCQDLFINGTEICCSKNCWTRWDFTDAKRSLADWY